MSEKSFAIDRKKENRFGVRVLCRQTAVCFCFWLFPLVCTIPAYSQDDQQAEEQITELARKTWASVVQPIIENNCLDCHMGDDAEGSLDLDSFQDLEDVVEQRRLWSKIGNRVRDGQMPPPEADEMSQGDRDELLTWIDQVLPQVPCQHPHHAGPVTIRRLTRYEYANTIRELLQVEYPFSNKFPADEVGYGFDNIGDVLSVSPLLMEKYLSAAEEISELVITDPRSELIDQTIALDKFNLPRGVRKRRNYLLMTVSATATTDVTVAVAGQYKISVAAFAHQAGDEIAKMAISVNGKLVEEIEVEAESIEDSLDHELEIDLNEGENDLHITFTNDYYNPEAESRRDRNLAIVEVNIKGPVGKTKKSAAHQAFLFAMPDDGIDPAKCAEQIIDRHAFRAFRRPVQPVERERLLKLFEMGIENGESFEGAMRIVLQGILVSPHFIYKVEQPASGDGELRPLNGHELATAMSYFLWSSMPDAKLFELADDNKLQDERVMQAEVQRMLQHPSSIALVDNFAAQWLQLRILDQSDPDPDLFPGFTDHLRKSMLNETRLLLMDVIQNDAPLTTLLTSDYTYVNLALAEHYGMKTSGLSEQEFSKVSLQGTGRQGLLSHASILTITSNPTRTSPVKRGKWVLENLLADPPPPALPDVPQLDSQDELTGTLRERMEQHREDPNCAVCHYKMDSLGFALEKFDAYGRFREHDGDDLIDSKGELPNGDKFASPSELQELIVRSQRQQFIRCVTEKLFIYAVGRGPIAVDDCVIDEIAGRAFREDYRFSEIVTAIVTSEPFRNRSSPNASN